MPQRTARLGDGDLRKELTHANLRRARQIPEGAARFHSPGRASRAGALNLMVEKSGHRYNMVVRKSAAPQTPTTIEPYQTSRTRVSAATAPSAIATWNSATLSANR